MRTIHILGILSFFLGTNASANFLNGNDLYRDLMSTAAVDQATSRGYVIGAADASEKSAWCHVNPDKIARGQVIDIVKKFLAAHPELRHHTADSLVAGALNAVWPCK